eukprot:349893-Chlamydomonas_euryale.AAC.6
MPSSPHERCRERDTLAFTISTPRQHPLVKDEIAGVGTCLKSSPDPCPSSPPALRPVSREQPSGMKVQSRGWTATCGRAASAWGVDARSSCRSHPRGPRPPHLASPVATPRTACTPAPSTRGRAPNLSPRRHRKFLDTPAAVAEQHPDACCPFGLRAAFRGPPRGCPATLPHRASESSRADLPHVEAPTVSAIAGAPSQLSEPQLFVGPAWLRRAGAACSRAAARSGAAWCC